MSEDEKIVLGLLRRLMHEAYVDTASSDGIRRFTIDGCIWDVTESELAALGRWWDDK